MIYIALCKEDNKLPNFILANFLQLFGVICLYIVGLFEEGLNILFQNKTGGQNIL